MKKQAIFFGIIFISMVSFVVSSKAQQQLPNPNFELWDTTNKPESWNIIEVDLGVFGTYYSAEQTTDAAFGSYAVKLETQSILEQQDMPGYVALGEFDLTTFMPSGGIPFNSRPTALFQCR
ncbi:MAG: hypothetical protein U9N85_07790, partial [Bacteroidota bacterium]|nr:hypothetical protein [Bacteroidota bacterium]